MGAAAGAAVAHHRARKDEEQQPEYSEEPVQYAPPPPTPADEIEHLAQLHASGVLTDEEFTSAKAKILGS